MFKVTKVRNELKKSHRVFWYRDAEFDYVMNGYWILKTDLKQEKYRKVLSVLVEKLGTIPNAGEEVSTRINRGIIEVVTVAIKPDWMNFLEKKGLEEVEDTKLTITSLKDQLRIFKGKEYIYVNINYIQMIDVDITKIELKGTKPLEPLYINYGHDLFMVLPVRIATGDTSKHLKEIEKEDKKDSKGLQSQKSQ